SRKRKISRSKDANKDSLLGIEELDAINKLRKDNKLGNISHLALLLLREGQQALKNKQFDKAEKLNNYAIMLAPDFPSSYYAQGYLYMRENWKAFGQYFLYYFKGIMKIFKHQPSLFIKIYQNILILLFCLLLFYIIITVSISAKHLPTYLYESTERYKNSIAGNLIFVFMIAILFVPFVFNFSILWLFLYFPVMLWPFLKTKEKTLILFLLIALIFFEPFIMHSIHIISHSDFEEYDFPSVLIYETKSAKEKDKLASIFTIEDVFQKKIVLSIWSEITDILKRQKVKALLVRPITHKYSNIIFNPLIYFFWIFLMSFLRISPQLVECGICHRSCKNYVMSSIEKRLICNNCYLLFNHGLEIKFTEKRKIEDNLKAHYNIERIISYCLPGFIQFWEQDRISILFPLLFLCFILINFYLSLSNSLTGRFLILNNWQIIVVFYLPIILVIYFLLFIKDRKIIKDKEKKLKALISR
ncbi:MAG: tetratricopeptide repeat protein, partial [bacterium]